MALAPLNFPTAPTLNQTYPNPPVTGQPTYTWDGNDWISKFALGTAMVPLDGSQPMTGPLTLSQDPTALMHAVTKQYVDAGQKNYIVNGAMMISQEYRLTPVTANNSFAVDQFSLNFSNAGTQTAQQIATTTPRGSPNRLRVMATVTSAITNATDYCVIRQGIEGLRCGDLLSGAAVAKTATLQFGVKAPAGIYCVALGNSAANRSYVAEYVIASGEANTDVLRSITIPLDKTGTWATDNTAGMYISWGLMCGSNFQTIANTWQGGNFYGTASQYNFMATINNTFELFDVGLFAGNVAPQFVAPNYETELAVCQRYFCRSYSFGVAAGTAALQTYITLICAGTAGLFGSIPFPSTMRTSPTVAVWSYNGSGNQCSDAAGINAAIVTVVSASSWGIVSCNLDRALTAGQPYVIQYQASARM